MSGTRTIGRLPDVGTPVEVVLERIIDPIDSSGVKHTNWFRVYRRTYIDMRNAFATVEMTPGTDAYSVISDGPLSEAERLAVYYAVKNWYAPRKGVHYRELQLGDRVRLFDGDDPGAAYMDATVINVTEKDVTFFRPYVHIGDFSHTGGVTPYIGTEQFSVPRDHGTGTVSLLHREKDGAIK